MNLATALLNAKLYIHEPKYHAKEKMWGFDICKKDRWVTYYFLTEEMAWTEFYNQFRAIKESLMQDKERGGK